MTSEELEYQLLQVQRWYKLDRVAAFSCGVAVGLFAEELMELAGLVWHWIGNMI